MDNYKKKNKIIRANQVYKIKIINKKNKLKHKIKYKIVFKIKVLNYLK